MNIAKKMKELEIYKDKYYAKKAALKKNFDIECNKWYRKFIKKINGQRQLTKAGITETEKHKNIILKNANVGERGRCCICGKKVNESACGWFSFGMWGQHHTCAKHMAMAIDAIIYLTK